MDWLIALFALTAMEIVLGIDNVVFIAILAGRLPKHRQASARRAGLAAALVMRVLLLLTLKWILQLTAPIFTVSDFGLPASWMTAEVNEVSTRDLILFVGGLFLIGKSVREIHEKIEGHGERRRLKEAVSFSGVLVQIAILDMIFSLDSVITAVGMAEQLWVMIVAVVLAVCVMLIFAGAISAFVERHPTMKMLALSFLIMIGVMLVAEAIGTHIDKGYIYFAMAFALVVEVLNLRIRKRAKAAAAA